MFERCVITFVALFSSSLYADQIWQPSTRTPLESLEKALNQSTVVVVGEDHYDPSISAVEAKIVKILHDSVTAHNGKATPLTLGWEFLNLVDEDRVANVSMKLKGGTSGVLEALAELFPGQEAPAEYQALIETATIPGINLVPTNLTRAEKQPVTQNGMKAADPLLVPPDFALGSAAYFERFQEAMGSHPLPSPIENYFASQSLTDDVMAYALLSSNSAKKVLITGAFHGDYRDGVVSRLALRAPQEKVVYVKVINSASYSAEEIEALFSNRTYGPIADILYIIEP